MVSPVQFPAYRGLPDTMTRTHIHPHQKGPRTQEFCTAQSSQCPTMNPLSILSPLGVKRALRIDCLQLPSREKIPPDLICNFG